jgi:hypothetical protein
MKQIAAVVLLLFGAVTAAAGELAISSKEPVVVTAPDQWKCSKDPLKHDPINFPFEAFQVVPPGGRNAVCLFSILDKNPPKVATREFLASVVIGDSRPYVSNEGELQKLKPRELKINDGFGFYLNFVDPDLVGKPARNGKYKTATPIILYVGGRYIVKATLLCDDLKGAEYRDLMKIVESINIKKQ